jgi:aryl-alcohol dehydrogenase-like predicted oxidoreductase
MRTRQLGRSGITVGEIGLGTWSLSGDGYGPVTPDDARATLEAALEEGVTFLETSDCYAEGRVESLLGEVLEARGRASVVVSTRIGVDRSGEVARKRFEPEYITRACEASLKRLRSDYVDALVLHNPLPHTLRRPETWSALEALKKSGKARLVGASVGSVEAGEAAVSNGADVLVVPYNLLYSKVLHGLSAAISGAKVAVVARSPFGYGVLADTWGASRRFRDDDHRMYRWSSADLSRRVRQREALRPLVKGDIASLRDLALRYVLANGLVSVVTPGARLVVHARQNAHAVASTPYIPDADLAAMGPLLSSVGVEG